MTLPDSGSPHTITDAAQARLLTEPRSRDFFKPFLARERSASQAAEELGCSLNTLLYRIKTFLQADLLHVTREEQRAGRAVKYYRSVHDAYFVPFHLTPHSTLEERLEAQAAPIFATLIRSYAAALQQTERFGQHLLRAEDGTVWTTDFPPELTPIGLPMVYYDAVTSMGDAEARDLGRDLKALFERGTNVEKPDEDGRKPQPYMLMVALLPVDLESR